jgi:hypothetical protein
LSFVFVCVVSFLICRLTCIYETSRKHTIIIGCPKFCFKYMCRCVWYVNLNCIISPKIYTMLYKTYLVTHNKRVFTNYPIFEAWQGSHLKPSPGQFVCFNQFVWINVCKMKTEWWCSVYNNSDTIVMLQFWSMYVGHLPSIYWLLLARKGFPHAPGNRATLSVEPWVLMRNVCYWLFACVVW